MTARDLALTAQDVLEIARREEYLTLAEYARFYRLPERTARHLVVKGAVPHERFGRQIRIPSRVILQTSPF